MDGFVLKKRKAGASDGESSKVAKNEDDDVCFVRDTMNYKETCEWLETYNNVASTNFYEDYILHPTGNTILFLTYRRSTFIMDTAIRFQWPAECIVFLFRHLIHPRDRKPISRWILGDHSLWVTDVRLCEELVRAALPDDKDEKDARPLATIVDSSSAKRFWVKTMDILEEHGLLYDVFRTYHKRVRGMHKYQLLMATIKSLSDSTFSICEIDSLGFMPILKDADLVISIIKALPDRLLFRPSYRAIMVCRYSEGAMRFFLEHLKDSGQLETYFSDNLFGNCDYPSVFMLEAILERMIIKDSYTPRTYGVLRVLAEGIPPRCLFLENWRERTAYDHIMHMIEETPMIARKHIGDTRIADSIALEDDEARSVLGLFAPMLPKSAAPCV